MENNRLPDVREVTSAILEQNILTTFYGVNKTKGALLGVGTIETTESETRNRNEFRVLFFNVCSDADHEALASNKIL